MLDVEALGVAPAADHEALALRLEAARRRGAYALLLLAERLLGRGAAVGTDAACHEERIRLRHDPSLAFSTGEVSRVRVQALAPDAQDPAGEARTALEITTAFLGLSGSTSPLPSYLAEEIALEDEDAPRRRDFLDVFHHRFISLYYRARARSDHPNGYRSDQSDPWSTRILALLGRDSRPGIERWRLLRWAPLLAERSLTPAALATIVADVLEEDLGRLGVDIEPLVGGWAEIDPLDRNRLGRACSTLGKDLVLGRRILDRAGKFRIVVGPLSREDLAHAQERKEALRRLAAVLAELCPPSVEVELWLWLTKDAAPHLALGQARLGRDSWLGGQIRETQLRVELPA
jgi:type VI secretion system protein ImpH